MKSISHNRVRLRKRRSEASAELRLQELQEDHKTLKASHKELTDGYLQVCGELDTSEKELTSARQRILRVREQVATLQETVRVLRKGKV